MAQCLRALIRNGMGETLFCLSFLYVSFILKIMLLRFIYDEQYFTVAAFVPRFC